MTRQNWLYWHKSVETDVILDIASKQTVQDATTFGGLNEDYRRSKVSWLSGNDEIGNLLWPYVQSAAEAMNIDIAPMCELQYTEYHGSQGGKYDWHHDVDWNRADGFDRKLSVTVQLSDPEDYEGGIFEFGDVEQPSAECRDKGTILIFPSYLPHRVTPVTSGVRKTLVAWFEGPTWR